MMVEGFAYVEERHTTVSIVTQRDYVPSTSVMHRIKGIVETIMKRTPLTEHKEENCN